MSEKKEKKEKNYTVKRIGGYLYKVFPVVDSAGKVLETVTAPFQVELKPRDMFQIIVGAYLLAVPVAFTEEVWVLSEELPLKNIYYIAGLSVFFVSSFIYSNFYRFVLLENFFNFIKRIIATYGLTLFAVGLFLTFIDKCPWETDRILAMKRVILVSFPASMSATLSDTIK